MGQLAQLPQSHSADLPCFFFLTMLTIIAAATAASTAQMTMVQIFADIHWIIHSSPLRELSRAAKFALRAKCV